VRGLYYNRRLAALIVCAAAVLEIFIGGAHWLAVYRKPAEESLAGVIGERLELANGLVIVAERNIKGSAKELATAAAKLESVKTPEARLKANKELTGAAGRTAEALKSAGVSGEDEKYLVNIPVDMESLNTVIRTGGYNEPAREYNARLNGVIAKLIKAAGLARDLPLAE
jgi:hypothetical protein